MILKVPILERSRRYGYIYWTSNLEESVRGFFGTRKKVQIYFMESLLGEKRIDWTHRRISVGWKQTRSLPARATIFRLTFTGDDRVNVECL